MFWKKKQPPKSEPSDRDIIGGLLQSFLNNDDLDPVYIHGIGSEDEANAYDWKELPLVYLWGEHTANGDVGYSLSVNGPLVGLMLEAVVSRESPRFAHLRDTAMETIRDLSLNSVSSTCAQTGMTPAELFSK